MEDESRDAVKLQITKGHECHVKSLNSSDGGPGDLSKDHNEIRSFKKVSR